jgi:hypothetical protein
MTNQIFVEQKTGELRGTKPRRPPIGLILLAGAAFAGLSCIGVALTSPPSTQVGATGGREAIPVRSINGSMYVYANLGGVPHNMILDTGASSRASLCQSPTRSLLGNEPTYYQALFGLPLQMDRQCQTNVLSFIRCPSDDMFYATWK